MVSRKNNRPEDGNFQNKKNKRIKIENSGAEVLDSKSIITKVIVKIEAESLVLKLKEPLTGIKLRNTTELRNTTKIPRPTPEECKYVTDALSALHPDVVERSSTRRKTLLEACGMRNSITDSIVSTMLSQNTTDANSKAAFKNLKEKFKDWESLVKCDDMSEIEDAIRVAGLARTRAERIHRMLSTVLKDKGELSMEFLRDFSDEEVKSYLSGFKGLGPKTISCVLLFALGRDEFPVDTHVLRITQKMGWVSGSTSREKAYEYLNKAVPPALKMDLHCLLVSHGKHCHRCAANGKPQFPPKDGSKLNCPLVKVSGWSGEVPNELKGSAGKVEVKAEVKMEVKPDVTGSMDQS